MCLQGNGVARNIYQGDGRVHFFLCMFVHICVCMHLYICTQSGAPPIHIQLLPTADEDLIDKFEIRMIGDVVIIHWSNGKWVEEPHEESMHCLLRVKDKNWIEGSSRRFYQGTLNLLHFYLSMYCEFHLIISFLAKFLLSTCI